MGAQAAAVSINLAAATICAHSTATCCLSGAEGVDDTFAAEKDLACVSTAGTITFDNAAGFCFDWSATVRTSGSENQALGTQARAVAAGTIGANDWAAADVPGVNAASGNVFSIS